jgi:hypothetical protein
MNVEPMLLPISTDLYWTVFDRRDIGSLNEEESGEDHAF